MPIAMTSLFSQLLAYMGELRHWEDCVKVNIRMKKLNTTTIAGDGKSAVFGDDILGVEVKNSLWAVDKQTGV